MIDFSNVKKWLIGGVEVKKVVRVLDSTVLWQAIQRVLKEWRGSSPLTCTPTIVNPFEEVRVYGDSKQNPIRSRNLLDKNNLINGYYSATGVLTGATQDTYKTYDKFPVKPNTNYIASSSASPTVGVYWRLCFWDKNKKIISRDTRYINVQIGFNTGDNIAYVSISPEKEGWNYDLQVEEGAIATPYVPYMIDTPTPQTPIKIESVGEKSKNLFCNTGQVIRNYSNGLSINLNKARLIMDCTANTGNYQTLRDFQMDLKANIPYTFSWTGTFENATLLLVTGNYKTKSLINQSSRTHTFTLTEDTTLFLAIRCMTPDIPTLADVNIQLEEGSQATEFAPYNEYKVPVVIGDTTTNIYLNQPLRKVGEYADTMSVEGNNVTVVRNIYEIKGENLPIALRSDFETSGDMYVTFGYQQTFPRCIAGLTGTIRTLCSNYKAIPTVYRGSALNKSVCLENGYKTFNIKDTSMIGKTVSEIQSEISDYVFTYVMDTPTTETYTIEQPINALENTTIINVDTTIPPSELYASQYVEE